MTTYQKKQWLIERFVEINGGIKGFFTRFDDELALKVLEEFTFYYFGAVRIGWDELIEFWKEELED